MPKFTLIAEHTDWQTGDVNSKITSEFAVESVTEVLENIQMFLRGVGYHAPGTLDFVEFDPPSFDEHVEPVQGTLFDGIR